ncbi:MAG: ATP-dependent DNA helicase RecG [Oscillospiraceae bacterium]
MTGRELTAETLLEQFPGIGPTRGKKLLKLGLATAGDLMDYFPRQYEDRSKVYTIGEAPLGEPVCVAALVAEEPRLSFIRRGLDLVKLRAVDGGGTLGITFFNQSYTKDVFSKGQSYIFYGAVEEKMGLRTMTNPAFEREGAARFTGRIMPRYPLTAGISNNLLAGLTLRCIEAGLAEELPEGLPDEVRRENGLLSAANAYEGIHFPKTMEEGEKARERFAFEELFYLTVGLARLKNGRQSRSGIAFQTLPTEEFLKLLDFAPTGAQRRVMEECREDLTSGRVMNRLVQGDVGSGKTAVAAYCAFLAAKSGSQSAMMVPTELLAQQHYASLSALLEPAHITVALLTGSTPQGEKKRIYKALAQGDISLVIGTHALFSKGVSFQNLGLVIADEQHRFGVEQRAALSAKGVCPHVLVMSATPIPRTLALIIYGDLDVSVIDELPPGRQPVETFLVGESKRQRMYGFAEKLVGEGRQVYIVCPAVEENPLADPEGADLKAVTAYAQELQTKVFPGLRVGFVHGKMKPREKSAIMGEFCAGELDILVSTTVIEVGMDVANAAVMIVENADRFGLSQLHQLRGRVGRGGHQSYCILMSSTRNPDTRARLSALCATTDGFKIAEEDLKLRGPGDFFGQRQHGLPALKLADLSGDMRVFDRAQQAAQSLLRGDPTLEQPEHQGVLARVRKLFGEDGASPLF